MMLEIGFVPLLSHFPISHSAVFPIFPLAIPRFSLDQGFVYGLDKAASFEDVAEESNRVTVRSIL